MNFLQMLDLVVYGNSLRMWLVAVLTGFALYLLLRLLVGVSKQQLGRLSRRTANQVDNVIASAAGETKQAILLVAAMLWAGNVLDLPQGLMSWLDALIIILLLLQLALWGNAFIVRWAESYSRAHREENADGVTTMRAVAFIGRLVLFTVLLIFALDNIPGVEITTLIASLGIGGVAVALAVQNILGDLFASLSISFDKPFVVGDFIQVGDFLGQVENIGLKTTRLRSLSGEQLIFSNGDLLESRVRNYKRMSQRRIVFSFGVVYQTGQKMLEQIPQMIEEMITARERLRFDRAHFKGFGPSSLDFEVVYYVLDADYNLYMDEQQVLNLGLVDRFRQKGIEFAFPTRTLLVEQMPRVHVEPAANGSQEEARAVPSAGEKRT